MVLSGALGIPVKVLFVLRTTKVTHPSFPNDPGPPAREEAKGVLGRGAKGAGLEY